MVIEGDGKGGGEEEGREYENVNQVAASEMKNPVAYFLRCAPCSTDIYVGNLAVRQRCCLSCCTTYTYAHTVLL